MQSNFPASNDTFSHKIDNVDVIRAIDVNHLQSSVVRVENNLSLLVEDNKDLLTLCHFNGSTSGYRGVIAEESGPVRYKEGRYEKSVFIESAVINHVKNPAFRVSDNLWNYIENTGSVISSRTMDSPLGIRTDYCFQLEVDDTGDVDVTIKTSMEGLLEDASYTVSFWVKNNVSNVNFSGTNIKIAYDNGSGIDGSSFDVSPSWNRVSSVYQTAQGQDSFVLEIRFEKEGADIGDQILFCGFQVEESSFVSTYCDGDQGSGYAWQGESNASISIRNNTCLKYPANTPLQSVINNNSGSIGFWLKPYWDSNDSSSRFFFDTIVTASKKRLSIYKDTNDKIIFMIVEPDDSFAAVTSIDPLSWVTHSWVHIVCTYYFNEISNAWELDVFVDGEALNVTSTGNANTSSPVADYFIVGSSDEENHTANACFDEFWIFKKVLNAAEIKKIYSSPIQLAEGVLRVKTGSDISDENIGVEKSIAHHLGEIPSFIEITEKGPGIVYLSSDSDSENFYVKSSASSIDFDWRAWR